MLEGAHLLDKLAREPAQGRLVVLAFDVLVAHVERGWGCEGVGVWEGCFSGVAGPASHGLRVGAAGMRINMQTGADVRG